MTPFTTLTAVTAPMPDADIDTDIIFPARFLTLTQKRGLGRYAFHDKRFDDTGAERPDYRLSQAPWSAAGILVTGPNFGCGSSREQAPWALADLGIRCLVGPGFGDIFEANCHRNGMLTVRLEGDDHAALLEHARGGGTANVDLRDRTLRFGERIVVFDVPDAVRDLLLEGVDEIDRIRRDEGRAIAAFEQAQRRRMPWLYDSTTNHQGD